MNLKSFLFNAYQDTVVSPKTASPIIVVMDTDSIHFVANVLKKRQKVCSPHNVYQTQNVP